MRAQDFLHRESSHIHDLCGRGSSSSKSALRLSCSPQRAPSNSSNHSSSMICFHPSSYLGQHAMKLLRKLVVLLRFRYLPGPPCRGRLLALSWSRVQLFHQMSQASFFLPSNKISNTLDPRLFPVLYGCSGDSRPISRTIPHSWNHHYRLRTLRRARSVVVLRPPDLVRSTQAGSVFSPYHAGILNKRELPGTLSELRPDCCARGRTLACIHVHAPRTCFWCTQYHLQLSHSDEGVRTRPWLPQQRLD